MAPAFFAGRYSAERAAYSAGAGAGRAGRCLSVSEYSQAGAGLADCIRPRYRMRAAERKARRCATRRAASDNAFYVRGNLSAPPFHPPEAIRLFGSMRSRTERQRRSGRMPSLV